MDDLEGMPGFTEAPTQAESKSLTELGVELFSTDSEIAEMEIEIERLKELRKKICMVDLPKAMQEIGQDKIGLPEFNVDLVLRPYFHANIKAEWPEEQRKEAFDWLENSGNGDLVKTTMTMTFGRTELWKARWIVGIIRTVRKYVMTGDPDVPDIPEPEIHMGVAWNTLTAFVKEQITKGEKLPLDILGATVGNIVEIKKRKGK